mgnify:CR=1 FL=1
MCGSGLGMDSPVPRSTGMCGSGLVAEIDDPGLVVVEFGLLVRALLVEDLDHDLEFACARGQFL